MTTTEGATRTTGRTQGSEPNEELDDVPPDDDELSTEAPASLRAVVRDVGREARRLQEGLAVSIGRAVELTGLKETQIRYFEGLGALQPAKAADRPNANRLYSLADLQRLQVLERLTRQSGMRPADAARMLKRFGDAIDRGDELDVPTELSPAERYALDLRLATRLAAQLTMALEVELGTPVAAVLIPTQEVSFEQGDADEHIQAVAWNLWQHADAHFVAVTLRDQRLAQTTGSNSLRRFLALPGKSERTVIIRPANQERVLPDHTRFVLYTFTQPSARGNVVVQVFIATGANHERRVSTHLAIPASARRLLVERLATWCRAFADRLPRPPAKIPVETQLAAYGHHLSHSQRHFSKLLDHICDLVFPGDPQAAGMLLIPTGVRNAASLIVLAGSQRYDADLANRVKLSLRDEGEGLSGRAFNLGEPFFSRDAQRDRNVAYAAEEESQVALAVPLNGVLGTNAVGVLYLLSRSPGAKLDNDTIYLALALGAMLAERVEQWWLVQLQREQARALHENLDSVRQWLDVVAPRGRGYDQAIARLLSIRTGAESGGAETLSTARVTILLLDIDQYTRVVQRFSSPFLLKSQHHVLAVVRSILRKEHSSIEGRDFDDVSNFWFRNDHMLLVLDGTDADAARRLAQRMVDQVPARSLDVLDPGGKNLIITVSAAFKVLSKQELLDLGDTEAVVRQQLEALIEDLRIRTSQCAPQSVIELRPEVRR